MLLDLRGLPILGIVYLEIYVSNGRTTRIRTRGKRERKDRKEQMKKITCLLPDLPTCHHSADCALMRVRTAPRRLTLSILLLLLASELPYDGQMVTERQQVAL